MYWILERGIFSILQKEHVFKILRSLQDIAQKRLYTKE